MRQILMVAAIAVLSMSCASGADPEPAAPVSETTSTSTSTSSTTSTSTTTLSPTQQARQDSIDARAANAEEARIAWEAYHRAVEHRDGATAAGLVTPLTFDWYDDIRLLAIEASRSELEAAPFTQSLGAINLRLGLGDQVTSLSTGEEAYIRLVELGAVRSMNTADHALFGTSEITVDVRIGTTSIAQLQFIDDVWRYDAWRIDNNLAFAASRNPDALPELMEIYIGSPMTLAQFLDLIEPEGVLDPPVAG